MADEIGAPIERPAEIGRRQGIIDDERDAGVVRDRCDLLVVDDDAAVREFMSATLDDAGAVRDAD